MVRDEPSLKISDLYLLRFRKDSVWKIFPKRMTQLTNDGGVCRTAPATPGLIIIETEEEEKCVMAGQNKQYAHRPEVSSQPGRADSVRSVICTHRGAVH